MVEFYEELSGISSLSPRIAFHFFLISLFLGGAILLLLRISMEKSLRVIRKKRQESIKSRLKKMLTQALMEEESSEDPRKEFTAIENLAFRLKKNYLSSKVNRNILVEMLLSLSKNIGGTTSRKIKHLYQSCELQKDALEKLNSPSWELKARAIRELSQMEYKKALPLFIELLSESKRILNQEAQLGIVKLAGKNPLFFLSQKPHEITRWQKICLHNNIRNLAHKDLPDFGDLVRSPEPSISRFGLLMLATFQQQSGKNATLSLLEGDLEEKTWIDLLKVINSLHLHEAVYQLESSLDSVGTAIKKEILKSLGRVGNEEQIGILSTYLASNRPELAVSAAEALKALGPAGEKILVEMGKRPDCAGAVAHAQDPLLKAI